MAANVDVYWSFRSPYSYLATPDMLALADKYNVQVNLRIVLPIAVRAPDFFNPENAKRGRYIQLDWPRRAEILGMAHAWPSPDPIVQNLETFEIAKEQPYIYRLSKLGVEAQRQGKGIEFTAQVSKLLFGGTKDWHLGDHMAQASARAGLKLEEMERAIDQGTHLQEIEENQKQLEQSGHWGVPTYVFNNEPFFGQDRIDLLCWRLDQHKLKRA
ncbi:MAG: 2-hydroxychromene-2-carboxylate isomerase [Gammaproteobacteria bacterium]|nr:MAG: 2-hydroxychromene-2-carboxylate isomerase [Gammaproteobacteria bacterium]